MKNKTLATWLAFVGGPLGLHRFYLFGRRDYLGWILPWITLIGLYGFDRERTDDGLWFTRDVDWHLEGREVVINREVDYHEKMIDIRRAAP